MAASSLTSSAVLFKLRDRYARLLPSLAEAVLVVLLAYALATLAWKLVPVPAGSGWTPPAVSGSSTGAGKIQSGPNVESIASAHLFGQYQAPAEPALSELSSAPDTRLDLTLMGILSATAERGSRALISSSDGQEKPYAIGDDVVRDTRLQAIFPDRVILARAGQLETLRLDKNAPRTDLPGTYSDEETGDEGVADSGDPTAAMLSAVREELLADPSRASDYIRVQPASPGGQMRGYRIYPGRDRAAFTAVGLRPGDLVTSVNGIQLNDANQALQMLSQLSSAGSLTVVVERGGQQQTVNVNFQ
ncbi:MAG: type II secretion system protein GspC [Panacagrimonas sp.]